jgi:2-dehydro-3-deoxygalactonokinase
MGPSERRLPIIAVDWGTSRFRAYLIADHEAILGRVESDEGIAHLSGRPHRDVFLEHCQAWLAEHPAAMIVLVGMVGSRNGWVEVPYVEPPASTAVVAARCATITLDGARKAYVVPGVRASAPYGSDVMRGEEVLGFGAAEAGVVCLPGTHSKWVIVRGQSIVDLRTFVTGELFALVRDGSFIASLGRPGESACAFERGLSAAHAPEGLLATLFTARAGVLDGSLPPEGVGDYVSGLLIGTEIIRAQAIFNPKAVTVVGSPDLAHRYEIAMRQCGIEVSVVPSEQAFVRGVMRIAAEIEKDAS